MLSKIALIAVGLSAVSATSFNEVAMKQEFLKFMDTYGKEYAGDEVEQRFATFKKNFAKISAHDASASYTLAINEFADMTWEEFHSTFTGYKHRERSFIRSQNLHVAAEGETFADSMDWRDKKVVTPVKDQGQCGSCWAFSTTGSVESAVAIKDGNGPVSLSEQQLVDCAGSTGNEGCSGGLMDDAFEWIISNKGLAAESAYPYKGIDGKCNTTATSVSTITGYKDVKAGDEDGLMSALKLGPVSIAIEADQSAFQFYSGGVLTGTCGKQLDHGVLLVGYGTDKNDYWLVKNSWGASWGENGYVRIERGSDKCGIADSASYPIA